MAESKKRPDLAVTIQRKIVGPRHDLESLPGFWFKPKKFSSEGGEEIQAAQFQVSKKVKNPVIVKYMQKLRNQGLEKITIKTITDHLSEEELGDPKAEARSRDG